MAKPPKQKRPGRPPKAEAERRSRNLTFRAREGMHKQLTKAAISSGRSMSEEIEHRLARSLEEEDFQRRLIREVFGSYDLYKILKDVSAAMNEEGERQLAVLGYRYPTLDEFTAGPAWLHDYQLYNQAVSAAIKTLEKHRPPEMPTDLVEWDNRLSGTVEPLFVGLRALTKKIVNDQVLAAEGRKLTAEEFKQMMDKFNYVQKRLAEDFGAIPPDGGEKLPKD